MKNSQEFSSEVDLL